MPKNEIAVVYARYSSHNQQEQSIEGQLAAARVYAENHGYTIAREYCDRAKTGTNDNREEFQRMLSDCAKKKFSVIIVWKVDRFGRNREEITFNKYKAKKHGVRVEYVAENISDGPEGVILESVLEGMAEYYSLQLSQNVQRGLLESAKKHHVLSGRVAYGYRIAADKTYEIDPDTAPIVKQIFAMYANGQTESEIIDHLNALGLRTYRGVAFNRSSLKTLLKNERYVGTYLYKDIIRDEDAIPAIIDKEIFQKVQNMLKINKKIHAHRDAACATYLLTGKLFCGECGSTMVGKSGTSHTGEKHCYYACLNHCSGKGCGKKSIRQDVIEPYVIEKANTLLHDPDLFNLIVEKTWEYYQKQDETQIERAALQKELADIEKGIGNLVRSIEAGIFSDAIKNRIDELEEQKAAVTKSLAEMDLASGVKLTKDRIQFFLERFRDAEASDPDCQKRIIDTFINSIFLYDDKMTIAFNYSGDNNAVTITDIKKATTGEGFACGRIGWAIRPTDEPFVMFWIRNVFAITTKIPGA